MKRIPLTQGLHTIVDADMYDFLTQWDWYAGKVKDGQYRTMRKEKQRDGSYRTIYMHRVIMDAPDDVIVDHIDGDPLHNWRSNLRACTKRENGYNKHMSYKHQVRKFTSKFKGVSRHKSKWRARLYYQGKNINLGCYPSQIEAALAYDRAARRYFGPFACTNFSVEGDNNVWLSNMKNHSNEFFPKTNGNTVEEAIS